MNWDTDFRGLKRRVLDLLYPPLCIACRTQVGGTGAFCPDCWQKVDFLDGASCHCCGLPFEFDPGPGALCASCLTDRPIFDRARAVMRYTEHSKAPVLAFKHADRLDLAPGFARWLHRAGRELIDESDLIVPVPLHLRRLWTRRYNQAAELCRHLGRLCRKPVHSGAIRRTRATPSQGEMPSANARRRNVQRAFIVPSSCGQLVGGRAVLLVDDVLTTGATADSCAEALKRAGAAKVNVLALARVVGSSTIPI